MGFGEVVVRNTSIELDGFVVDPRGLHTVRHAVNYKWRADAAVVDELGIAVLLDDLFTVRVQSLRYRLHWGAVVGDLKFDDEPIIVCQLKHIIAFAERCLTPSGVLELSFSAPVASKKIIQADPHSASKILELFFCLIADRVHVPVKQPTRLANICLHRHDLAGLKFGAFGIGKNNNVMEGLKGDDRAVADHAEFSAADLIFCGQVFLAADEIDGSSENYFGICFFDALPEGISGINKRTKEEKNNKPTSSNSEHNYLDHIFNNHCDAGPSAILQHSRLELYLTNRLIKPAFKLRRKFRNVLKNTDLAVGPQKYLYLYPPVC